MPDRPNKLPFEATNANVRKLVGLLLQRYSASTFNVCLHKPFQQMKYIWRIMLNLVLVIHQLTTIHWQKQVEADLNRDENLGVLECVLFCKTVN